MYGSTLMNPFSSETPASVRPSLSVHGLRPTATSRISPEIASASPWSDTARAVTPPAATWKASALTPVRILIFRFLNALVSSAEDSSSSPGRTRGSISTRVTALPKLL
jgi:hypothetical protein